MYTENHKTLRKEIEDRNKWNNIPHLWIGRVNIFQCPYYWMPFIYSVQPVSKSQCHFIITRKYNPKIHIKPQKKWIVKTILRKKKDGGTLPDFKPYYKIVGYWPKNRHTHQWKRIKNLEINYAYAAN